MLYKNCVAPGIETGKTKSKQKPTTKLYLNRILACDFSDISFVFGGSTRINCVRKYKTVLRQKILLKSNKIEILYLSLLI